MRVVNVEGVDIGVDPAARRITIPGGDDGHHHPAHPVNAVAFLAAGMWLRHLQRVVRHWHEDAHAQHCHRRFVQRHLRQLGQTPVSQITLLLILSLQPSAQPCLH